MESSYGNTEEQLREFDEATREAQEWYNSLVR